MRLVNWILSFWKKSKPRTIQEFWDDAYEEFPTDYSSLLDEEKHVRS